MDGVSNTTQASVLERLQEIFRTELDDDDLTIGLETRQLDLKAWDSLAHIRIVSGIESEFDFQFNLAEIEEINSVRQFVELCRAGEYDEAARYLDLPPGKSVDGAGLARRAISKAIMPPDGAMPHATNPHSRTPLGTCACGHARMTDQATTTAALSVSTT